MSSSAPNRALSVNNISSRVVKAEYAVRGALAVRSEQMRFELASSGKSNLPFDHVISANIGNPQQLGQKPITFFREVLSLLEYPKLIQLAEEGRLGDAYKPDAVARAKLMLSQVNSVGAYSASQGVLPFRKNVAKFIEERDGYQSDPANIFLTAGASAGVNSILTTICARENTGILIPVPQYPLYTATLSLLNATPVPYYLEESKAWGTNVEEIESVIRGAKENGTDVKCLVVINPGNPTGATLTEEEIKSIIRLAANDRIVIMADEVYQTNVFSGKFFSFKKVLCDIQKSEENKDGKFDTVELVSFHSISKGMIGECGHRGGYFELVGFHPDVQAQIYKLVSISLCPPVIGQCLVDLMVKPPQQGEESYEEYQGEYVAIYEELQKRATAIWDGFGKMEGVDCQEPQGAMYLFPTIKLPKGAIEAAEKEGKKPDEFYCHKLLEATGVCVVPGSGFGQRDGTWHFRTTFLAPGTDWITRVSKFHSDFMDEYR